MNQIANERINVRIKRSNRRIFVWTLVWLLTLALLAFGPQFIWSFSNSISGVVILANLFFGYKMIIANKHLLDNLDELQRRVHMNAMATSLGICLVFGAVYGLLEPARIIDYTPNPSNILFVMGISYLVSIFVGFKKYL